MKSAQNEGKQLGSFRALNLNMCKKLLYLVSDDCYRQNGKTRKSTKELPVVVRVTKRKETR